jgi:hypothetical protein
VKSSDDLRLPIRLAVGVLALYAGAVQAQMPAEPPAKSDAMNAPPAFRSALDGYRPLTEEAVADWKKANEEVGRIGGWRAYAREASGTSSEPGKTPAPAAKPDGTDPHSGHARP